MKTVTNIALIVSLAANVAIGGWWINKKRTRAVQSVELNGASPTAWSESNPTAKVSGKRQRSDDDSNQAIGSWADINSEDLKTWIAKLRAAGCPEETVQDLVLAEVNRRYSKMRVQLYGDSNGPKEFWETQRASVAEVKKNRERMREADRLNKQKSAMLVDLLGVDPEKQRWLAEGLDDSPSWRPNRIDFLPENKREAVQKFLDDFEDKMQDFYERNRGMYDAQYRAEQKQLEQERLSGLSAYLSPQELKEYELRNSQIAMQLSHDLQGMTLTREQYEGLFDVRKKYGDSIYNYGDINTPELRTQVEANKKAMKADLVASLGPEFVRDYERSQDYSYKQLVQLATRSELPADTASKIYDLKNAAEQNVKQLQQNTELTAELRQSALDQLKQETEKTVKATLGEENYGKYLTRGGYWIMNLSRPVRKP